MSNKKFAELAAALMGDDQKARDAARKEIEGLPYEERAAFRRAWSAAIAEATEEKQKEASVRAHRAALGRLTAADRTLLAAARPVWALRPTTPFRATRKGTSLTMPERNGTHEERRTRIAELEKELEAVHAERGV